MTTHLGIWMDHGKAIIMRMDGGYMQVQHLSAGVHDRPRVRRSSRIFRSHLSSGPVGPSVGVDLRRDVMMRKFFEKITETSQDAEKIVLLGISPSKDQLLAHLLAHGFTREQILTPWIARTKLNEGQFVAFVLQFFRRTAPVRVRKIRPTSQTFENGMALSL